MSRKKTSTLSFLCDFDWKAKVIRRAEAQGLTISDFMRELVGDGDSPKGDGGMKSARVRVRGEGKSR
jgi:hypothetical protein